MKKNLLSPIKCLLLILLQVSSFHSGFAQSEIIWQNPSTTTSFLYGIDIMDENTVFIAGNRSAQFLKTTNGGDSWEVTAFEGRGLWAIDFVNSNIGYVVSIDGEIYKSTDGGGSFTALNTGLTTASFWDVQFIDENKGWAVGRGEGLPVILYTEDGGANWVKQNHDSFSANGFTSVFFLNENIGWIGGYEYEIYKTIDGGENWTKQTVTEPNQSFSFVSSLEFLDENIGYATTTIGGANRREIIKTTDGGATWMPTADQSTLTYAGGQHFFDADNGYIVGRSSIIKTDNGGESWEAIYTPSGGETLLNIAFLNNDVGYVTGTGGLVLKTTDGGGTWESKRKGVATTLRSVKFIDRDEGWAVGNGGTIVHTINGGAVWEPQNAGTESTLNSVLFSDNSTGWAVGNQGTILKTADKGNNWEMQQSGTSQHLRSVYFINNEIGWAVGDSSGTISATIDGGNTWIFQKSSTEKILRSVFFIDTDTGWAVGSKGTIVRTNDGGENWNTQSSGTEITLNSVFFTNTQTGWAVGNEGEILHTTDGGTNWSLQTSPVKFINDDPYLPVDLYEAQFLNDSTGFITGRQGIILATSDAGETWTIEKDLAGTSFGIYFLSINSGWLVGSSGAILKYQIPLKITDFTPEQGPRGELVTITGSAFVGTTSVKFDELEAEFAVENNTTIVASVPEGVAVGPISVTTPEGTVLSENDFIIQIATGIEEELLSSEIAVYPNPTDSYFTINVKGLKSAGKLDMNLYNTIGKIVRKEVVIVQDDELVKTFNTSSLPAGIYILHINTGRSSIQRKIWVK